MTPAEVAAIVIAVAGPVVAWLLADARSKGRNEAIEEKVRGLTGLSDRVVATEEKVRGLTGLSDRVVKIETRQEEMSRRIDDNHDGLKEQLSELKELINQLRQDVLRRRGDTNPG